MFKKLIDKAVKTVSRLFSSPGGNVPESSPESSSRDAGGWKVAYIEASTRGRLLGGHIPNSGRVAPGAVIPAAVPAPAPAPRSLSARLESVREIDLRAQYKEWRQNIAEYDKVRATMFA